jgi:hypothetical protein
MANKVNVWLTISGKLTGVPPGTELPSDTYVFQRTNGHLANAADIYGNRMQVRRHVPQINPNTPAQQANRSVFRRGVAIYQQFDAEQKRHWKTEGIKLKLQTFQAWMRHYMRNQALYPATNWDDSAESWDVAGLKWDEQP